MINPDVGECFGMDPHDFDILVVKSTNHFYGGFAPIASELCYVNTGMLLDGMSDPRTPSTRARRPTRSLSRSIRPQVADPHGIGAPTASDSSHLLDLMVSRFGRRLERGRVGGGI